MTRDMGNICAAIFIFQESAASLLLANRHCVCLARPDLHTDTLLRHLCQKVTLLPKRGLFEPPITIEQDLSSLINMCSLYGKLKDI